MAVRVRVNMDRRCLQRLTPAKLTANNSRVSDIQANLSANKPNQSVISANHSAITSFRRIVF